MRRLLVFFISFLLIQTSHADNCPVVDNLNPQTPPGGWVLFNAPNTSGKGYYFASATHSVNTSYYYQHIFCRYETCPTPGCPAFTLLSNIPYQQPASNAPPWEYFAQMINTVVCKPTNHDPYQCLFTNQQT